MRKSILVLALAVVLVACGDKSSGPEPTPEITIQTPELTLPNQSGVTQTITFTSSGPWTAEVEQTKADEPWIDISPKRGEAGKATLTLTVTNANNTYDDRVATVRIAVGGLTKEIVLTQTNKDGVFLTQKSMLLPPIANELDVEVKYSVALEVVVPDDAKWITFEPTKAMSTAYLHFKIDENTDVANRTAKIIVRQAGGGLQDILTIQQQGSEQGYVDQLNPILAALNPVQLDTITRLALSGLVTSADFKMVKFNMPRVKQLDLRQARFPYDYLPVEALGGMVLTGRGSNLTSVQLPVGLVGIGAGAFGATYQGKLKRVPDLHNVEYIGAGAFRACFEFAQPLVLPQTLKVIGEDAFNYCVSLEGELDIPESVVSIGAGCFTQCYGFSSVRVHWARPIVYKESMLPLAVMNGEVSTPIPLYVPAASVALYKAAEGWKNHTIIGY